MNVIQQISPNPITGDNREVHLLSFFPRLPYPTETKNGAIVFANDAELEAQYAVFDYRIINGEKKYIAMRYVVYPLHKDFKIRILDPVNFDFERVYESDNAEDWEQLLSENDTMLHLLFNTQLPSTMADLQRKIILNLDDTRDRSIFN